MLFYLSDKSIFAALATHYMQIINTVKMVQPSQDSKASTPPHHPIHGIQLSDSEVRTLLDAAFPNSNLLSISPLQSGRSFNNRIYFLKAQLGNLNDQRTARTGHTKQEDLVLKVNGRFFGAAKVQNETSSLWLLERFCPDVPAPRVLAWSEDGKHIASVSGDRAASRWCTASVSGSSVGASQPGWLLMSRLPGETLSQLSLDEEALASIGSQVAQLTAAWRLSIPPQSQCGGICFSPNPISGIDLGLGPDPQTPYLNIKGIVGDNLELVSPVTSMLEYQKVKFEDKLRQLETMNVYRPNRQVGHLVRNFMDTTLPALKLISAGNDDEVPPFVFTHYDLSPRNILVKGNPPHISGVVDFEFSGFFPALDEFVNDFVDNGGDWPQHAYAAYMSKLGELGIATPVKGIDKEIWEQAHWLGQVLENIAPWWLPGDRGEEELVVELENSRKVVVETIEKLNKHS